MYPTTWIVRLAIISSKKNNIRHMYLLFLEQCSLALIQEISSEQQKLQSRKSDSWIKSSSVSDSGPSIILDMSPRSLPWRTYKLPALTMLGIYSSESMLLIIPLDTNGSLVDRGTLLNHCPGFFTNRRNGDWYLRTLVVRWSTWLTPQNPSKIDLRAKC